MRQEIAPRITRCMLAAQAMFTGNDWHPSWVANAEEDCAWGDVLHAGSAGGIGCAVQPEQTCAMLSRGPLETSVVVVRVQSLREEDVPRRREVWAKMAAPASVVKRGVADESGKEKAREQVEGERGTAGALFVYVHRVNVGSRSRKN